MPFANGATVLAHRFPWERVSIPQRKPDSNIFKSFWMGGFESSTHIRRDGRRLDLVASTQHDRFAERDYKRLRSLGMQTARDGIRWHLIEQRAGRYDWSSALPLVCAAQAQKMEIIWDLFHYGWPDGLDILSTQFVDRFAAFSRAFAKLLRDETDGPHFLTPVNEISFFSWAGGEVGYFNPCEHGRGFELKQQLVRAAIAGIEAVWDVLPHARIVHTDPMINVVPASEQPEDVERAQAEQNASFDGWNMIAGIICPELGGDMKYLDIIGINYYVHNQWLYPGGHGTMIAPSHPHYVPVRELLARLHERFGRPILIAETGIEDGARPAWLRYMATEVRAAIRNGVPVEGLCLYPIVNHPGWDDDRHCHNALWDYADKKGHRAPYQPLVEELQCQQQLLRDLRAGRDVADDLSTQTNGNESGLELEWHLLDDAARRMAECAPVIEELTLEDGVIPEPLEPRADGTAADEYSSAHQISSAHESGLNAVNQRH
jgi:hypothetical protein